MKFTRYALLGAVALSLMAATVAVVKKVSDYPRVTTPGTNDLILLSVPATNGLFGTGSTNKAVSYGNLKSSINAANQPTNSNLTLWSAIAPSAKQDALGFTPQATNSNLTLWSAIAPSSKQAASANLNDWSALSTNALTTGAPGQTNIYDITIITNSYVVNGKNNTLIITNQLILQQAALTYATNVTLNFDTQAYKTVSLTGNITFATTNLGAGKSMTVKLLGDGTARTLAFPAWTFIGTAAPATLATNKTAILTVTAFGGTDATCVAAYAAEP